MGVEDSCFSEFPDKKREAQDRGSRADTRMHKEKGQAPEHALPQDESHFMLKLL